MKKTLFWILIAFLPCLLAGCLIKPSTPEPPDHAVVIITVVVTATPLLTATEGGRAGPIVIVTALRTPPALAPTPTPTPTQAPSATPTPQPSPTPLITPYVGCPSAYPTHLTLGAHAVVSRTPPKANRLREEPSTKGGNSTVGGWIQPDEEIVLSQGPICAEGWVWWKVTSITSGQSGWTSEGDGENYWLVPLLPQSGEGVAEQNAVTLTTDLLDSADDIEAAIKRATAEGTRPGTVILDGRNGAFVFTGDDRSVNIFVSNLTLRGVNQALIKNCGDGLFFDNFPLKNILVEDIEFVCEGEGVAARGSFENVTLYNNIFRARRTGIGMDGASSGWLISRNVIEAGQVGIQITGAKKMVISNNQISTKSGINLRQCVEIQVQKNTIQASYQGILLAQESWKNLVQMNTILGASRLGIALETGVTGNQILDNTVSCATGAACLSVDAAPDVVKMNTISPLPAEKIAYSTDFENSAGTEWSHNKIEISPSGRRFLGQFGNDAVTLNLNNLSVHEAISVVFELYIIRSWDGNVNPDIWQFKADGQSVLLTTFDNQDFYPDHWQAYPGRYGESSNRPRTGAKENNTLGYKFDNRQMDSVYVFRFTILHSSTNLELTFAANGLMADLADEGWGIDNVAIYTIK